MKSFKNYLLIFAITVLFASCTKAGPVGPAGNANVSSYTFNIISSDWVADATNYRYYVNLTLPQITDSVLNYGTINVFVDNGTGTYWNALPMLYFSGDYDYQVNLGFVAVYYTLGTSPTFVMPSGPPTGSGAYKVVVIP